MRSQVIAVNLGIVLNGGTAELSELVNEVQWRPQSSMGASACAHLLYAPRVSPVAA